MAKSTRSKNSFTLGEISGQMMGRFEEGKPIFLNAAAILENILINQNGSIMFRPGTIFAWKVKDSSKDVRLDRFQYSTSQQYIMEIGEEYIRFGANGGQLVRGTADEWATGTDYAVGNYVLYSSVMYYCITAHHSSAAFETDAADWVAQSAVEVPTEYGEADLFQLQMANSADVMYIVHPSYFPQKLIRTAVDVFSISDVPFIRGPFMDSNVSSTIITPSAATGSGITLTASANIFQPGHVKSLWRIKDGVVKITAFTNEMMVTGDVQPEPDGTAGNLGGTLGYTDWAEGLFSAYRGYPAAITFHEGRLLYGGARAFPGKWCGSVSGAFDNFDKGEAGDSDAYIWQIGSNMVNDIRWMMADVNLKFGTSGGTITAISASGTGITPSAPPQIVYDTDYAVMNVPAVRIGSEMLYLQGNSYQLRQLRFDLVVNRDKSDDMTLLADHVLRDGDGAVQMARQQSPHDRAWIPRWDGQLPVFTRNVDQAVQGWARQIAGSDSTGPGIFTSVAILPQEGEDDQIYVVARRHIGGVDVKYVEYFSPESFKNEWDPVRVDSSLSLNNVIKITNIELVG